MSTLLLGGDYLLWIESATPGTYNYIKGQGTAVINRSQSNIDGSSKDTPGYSTGTYGRKTITIDLDMVPKLPDANGYSRLEANCNAVPTAPFNIQIRKNGVNGVSADAIFAASVNGSISSVTLPDNDKVTAKGQLQLANAPTVDTLA